MGHYVYKFIDIKTNEVLYIGKNDTNLKSRLHNHFSNGKFKDYQNVAVYYTELANSTESSTYEKLMINKYKPILNIADNVEGITIEFAESGMIRYLDNAYPVTSFETSNIENIVSLLNEVCVKFYCNLYSIVDDSYIIKLDNKLSWITDSILFDGIKRLNISIEDNTIKLSKNVIMRFNIVISHILSEYSYLLNDGYEIYFDYVLSKIDTRYNKSMCSLVNAIVNNQTTFNSEVLFDIDDLYEHSYDNALDTSFEIDLKSYSNSKYNYYIKYNGELSTDEHNNLLNILSDLECVSTKQYYKFNYDLNEYEHYYNTELEYFKVRIKNCVDYELLVKYVEDEYKILCDSINEFYDYYNSICILFDIQVALELDKDYSKVVKIPNNIKDNYMLGVKHINNNYITLYSDFLSNKNYYIVSNIDILYEHLVDSVEHINNLFSVIDNMFNDDYIKEDIISISRFNKYSSKLNKMESELTSKIKLANSSIEEYENVLKHLENSNTIDSKTNEHVNRTKNIITFWNRFKMLCESYINKNNIENYLEYTYYKCKLTEIHGIHVDSKETKDSKFYDKEMEVYKYLLKVNCENSLLEYFEKYNSYDVLYSINKLYNDANEIINKYTNLFDKIYDFYIILQKMLMNKEYKVLSDKNKSYYLYYIDCLHEDAINSLYIHEISYSKHNDCIHILIEVDKLDEVLRLFEDRLMQNRNSIKYGNEFISIVSKYIKCIKSNFYDNLKTELITNTLELIKMYNELADIDSKCKYLKIIKKLKEDLYSMDMLDS